MQLYSRCTIQVYNLYTSFPDKPAGHNRAKLVVIYEQANIDKSHEFR